ncbi:MAG: hypothetical protein BLM47_08315 [Candidatus Reconcilbacillus cellulovorans]|uniref:Inositolphosphotransferase Aur1/Ipt1 domain-containing protein n=1 Tax=Candidatus Reconcilbacillus cellulovorans TaxID=1906605 RepID=A0A2A6DZQ2_9BACL|nr:MAG: hypothetical protein BLM47_08315 [Candidatus Reconcilbacillus cellulovorans]
MNLFPNLGFIALYTAATVFVLLWGALGRPPLGAAQFFVERLKKSRTFALHFAAMLAVLLLNKLEISLENAFSLSSDKTAWIFRIEGDTVARIQSLLYHPWLTPVFAYFYVVVFQTMLIGSLILYAYERNFRLYRAVCYAVMLNYILAIPFYLFFPVKEVHAFSQNVQFPMLEVYPNFESTYRHLSDLDNSFPSLHTSISVTMALLARKSGNRFWRWCTAVAAAVIVTSIFYLGIHWTADMVAGLALGATAAFTAQKLADMNAAARWTARKTAMRNTAG